MRTIKKAGSKVQLVTAEVAAKAPKKSSQAAANKRRADAQGRLSKAKAIVVGNKASGHSYAEQAEYYAKKLKDKAPDKPGALTLSKWLVAHMENDVAISRMPDKPAKAKKAAPARKATTKAAKAPAKKTPAAAEPQERGPLEHAQVAKHAEYLVLKALRSKDITPARAKNLVDKLGGDTIILALDQLSTSALEQLVKKLDVDKKFGHVYNYPLRLDHDDAFRRKVIYEQLGLTPQMAAGRITLDHDHIMKVATTKGHPFVGHQIYISAAKSAIAKAAGQDKRNAALEAKRAAKEAKKPATFSSSMSARPDPELPHAITTKPPRPDAPVTADTPATSIPVGQPAITYPTRGVSFTAVLNKPNLENYLSKQLRSYADRANADLHDDRGTLEANRALLSDINKDLAFAVQHSGQGSSAVSASGYPALIEPAGTDTAFTGALDALRSRVMKRIANGEQAKQVPVDHATLLAQHKELVAAVNEYLGEHESPVPDYTLRANYRAKLKALAAKPISVEAGRQAFDPFAVNVVAHVKNGNAQAAHNALMKLVSEDAKPVATAKLREIGKAQHIDLPNDGTESRDELIKALVAGAEKRLANRRNAAS